MSEENTELSEMDQKITDELGLGELADNLEAHIAEGEEQAEVEEVEQEEVELSPQEAWQNSQEESARSNGWKPLDEYVADGKDPSTWVTAEGYNIRGEFIGKLRNKDREVEELVESRVASVRKLHEAELNRLKKQRDEAITDGDIEAVNALDTEINALDTPQPTLSPQQVSYMRDKQEAEAEWNAKNDWINQKGAKSLYAISQYNQYLAQGVNPKQALSKVDADVASEFPAVQQKKGAPPTAEKGKGGKGFSSGRRHVPSVTFDDLTPAERSYWNEMPEAWGNDQQVYLKAVADSRASKG